MDDTTGRVGDGPEQLSGRGTDSTRGYAVPDTDNPDRRTREIREDIEQTREEMTETIDAIQDKLRPRNIVAQATDRVKSAASERVRNMADTASHTAQQAMDYTRTRTGSAVGQNPIPLALIGVGAAWLLTSQSRRSSSSARQLTGGYNAWDEYGEGRESDWDRDRDTGVMAKIRNNPIPAALAGVGLGWLAFAGNDRNESEYSGTGYGSSGYGTRGYGTTGYGSSGYEGRARWRTAEGGVADRVGDTSEGEGGTMSNIADSASQAASRTREYASGTADSMRRMARKRQNQMQRMMHESPLLVGAGALLLGAAFGLAVPETETENEWMGEARDNMMDQARQTARDAANQVQDAASTVVDAAQKLTGKAQS